MCWCGKKMSHTLSLSRKTAEMTCSNKIFDLFTEWKVSKYGAFSGPYFPAFWLNTKRYFVSLRIQSKCRKIRTRKNSVFGHISHSGYSWILQQRLQLISILVISNLSHSFVNITCSNTFGKLLLWRSILVSGCLIMHKTTTELQLLIVKTLWICFWIYQVHIWKQKKQVNDSTVEEDTA